MELFAIVLTLIIAVYIKSRPASYPNKEGVVVLNENGDYLGHVSHELMTEEAKSGCVSWNIVMKKARGV